MFSYLLPGFCALSVCEMLFADKNDPRRSVLVRPVFEHVVEEISHIKRPVAGQSPPSW